MNTRFTRWVRSAVGRPSVWNAINGSVIRAAEYVTIQRNAALEEITRRYAEKIFREKRVLHGPFTGMHYPGLEAVGSFLYPKLLGCYERELHPVIEELCGLPLPLIADIGCAEGYYAVGFAMRQPQARVVAFDIEPRARELCGDLARRNGMEGNVEIRSLCEPGWLSSPGVDSGLILSDCEGAERWLFAPETVPALKHFHLLIETHDRACPGTSDYLKTLFSPSHGIEAVTSVMDDFKVENYQYAEIADAEPWLKRRILEECRGVPMTWLVLRPRSKAG